MRSDVIAYPTHGIPRLDASCLQFCLSKVQGLPQPTSPAAASSAIGEDAANGIAGHNRDWILFLAWNGIYAVAPPVFFLSFYDLDL